MNTQDPRILLSTCKDGVVTLTLNRPDKRNALSRELLTQLHISLTHLGQDPSVRVLVLAAEGPVFCAGHDLGEMTGKKENEYMDLFSLCSTVMQQLRKLPQPVIARVQGLATAAGCQLIAACDLAVAADTATFATPGVKIGLFCTTPMVPLVRTIPPRAALEMLLLGKPITARMALDWGLINRAVPADSLDATVQEFVNSILQSSPLTIKIGKAAFYDGLTLDEATAYQRATEVMTRNACCQDAQEGIAAFIQKRKPEWTGK